MRKPVREGWEAKKDCHMGARTRKGPRSSRRVSEERELDHAEITVSSILPHRSSRRDVRFGLRDASVQRPGGMRSTEICVRNAAAERKYGKHTSCIVKRELRVLNIVEKLSALGVQAPVL